MTKIVKRHGIFPATVIQCEAYKDDGYWKVVINKGSDDGIEEGQNFLIYSVGDDLLDPVSGKSLGRLEIVRGRGYATHVQPKMTTISSNQKEETLYVHPTKTNISALAMAAMGVSNTGIGCLSSEKQKIQRKEQGKYVPFDGVEEGDLVKPI